jgi:hypothetical protein
MQAGANRPAYSIKARAALGAWHGPRRSTAKRPGAIANQRRGAA